MKTIMKTNRMFQLFMGMMFSVSSFAQQGRFLKTHSISLEPGFIQVKDRFNYGLTYNGVCLKSDYTFSLTSGRTRISYEGGLGLGLASNHGAGLLLFLKPADIHFWIKAIEVGSVQVAAGPYATAFYSWQLYPDLQSGSLFWLSSYELGPTISLSFPVSGRNLTLLASGAVISLNSRPVPATESYFYSSTLADFFQMPNTQLRTEFPNRFNHLRIEVAWRHPGSRKSLKYKMEWTRYNDQPGFTSLMHSLALNWNLNKR